MKEIGDSLIEWEIMGRIIFKQVKQCNSISNLAREIDVNIHNPLFYNSIRIMKERGIIEISNGVGSAKEIKIDLRKLEVYMRKRRPFILVDNFIHKTTRFAETGA